MTDTPGAMRHARLGESGLVVSRLALGTMTFALGRRSAVAKVGQDGATEMVARCLDAGVNFFDSADVYSGGDAETALGVALKARRDEAVICTKLGYRTGPAIGASGLSRGHVLRAVEASLGRLGTDAIDLLIAHRPDDTTPMEETLAALDTCVRHGKARHIGFSNWPAWQAARAIQFQRDNGLAPFVAGQLLYNLVQRDIELDLLPMMGAMGAGLMAWSPLSGGLLTGRYDPERLGDTGDGRLAKFDVLDFDPEAAKRGLAALREVAGMHGVAPASAALAWILARGRGHVALVGASKPSHLDDALAAMGLALAPDQMAALDAAAPPPRKFPERDLSAMTDNRHRDALS